MAFWQKRHFDKITGFTAFDKNHGFHDFRDLLLSVITVDNTYKCCLASTTGISKFIFTKFKGQLLTF